MNNERTIKPNAPADFTPQMGDYKTLQPFRYWCQKVLPLVYDDSLSYYELLCKVVDYLNKTMEDVETLHGDVTSLHSAYEELQGYVNNYFSTLDVQEEINKKLDKMASNGELYEIIRTYTDPIVNEQNEKINVLKARMDTFASLPAGSTSGDAELIDIRVGYNGITYPTAGDAVRKQIDELNDDLTLVGVHTPTYTVTHGKAMTTETTSLVDSSMFSIVNPIALNKGERISITCSTFAKTFGIIAICDADNTNRKIIVNSDGNNNTRYHYIAKDDCYVCLLINDSDTSHNIIIDELIPQRMSVVETSLEYDETFIKDLLSFEDIPLDIHVGSFYNSDVVYTVYANNSFQTVELAVEGGKYYHIHASSSFGNTIFAFLDSKNLVIEKVLDTTNSATGTVVDVNVKSPINAKTLRVGTFKGSGTLSVGIANGVAGIKLYSGITWAVFGDSLTEVNATAAKKYYDWLSEKYGMAIVNYGASGTGYHSSYDDEKAFYQRMANINPAAFDFLTIFGSGNDIKYLKDGTFPLGTANDYGDLSAEPTTLGGAINRTIEQYYTLCPTKPIGLITPTPWRAYCTGWRMNRGDALLMKQYSELIKEIGYIRGIPVLDLFNCSNLRPWDATNRTAYYNENGVQDGGTHPNSAGHKLIASQFDVFINSMYFAIK